MKSTFFRIAVLASLTCWLAAAPLLAQKIEKKDLPRSGNLSSSISGVYDSRAVPGPWGGVDFAGGDSSPISGSVSKSTGDRWIMRAYNNAEEDSYSVDLAVDQYDRDGGKVKSDSFSYRLKPKQSVERAVSSLAVTEQASLRLISWKKIESKSNKTEVPVPDSVGVK